MKIIETALSFILPLIGFASCSATNKRTDEINSYEECVAAGYPILKTYPPQCITPDKRVFIQGKEGPVKSNDWRVAQGSATLQEQVLNELSNSSPR